MTSEEISQVKEGHFSEQGWLKEIAYQLARMNERQMPSVQAAARKADADASDAQMPQTEFERKLAAANESLKTAPKKRK